MRSAGWPLPFTARALDGALPIFFAVTAAVVAYPIVWEATTRFGVITAGFAALILTSLSIVLIVAGRTFSLSSLAWIAAAGATFDALLLAFATKDVIPFMLELSIVGVAAFLAKANFVGAVLAVESDLVAAVLIALPLVAGSSHGTVPVAGALLLFALVWVPVGGHATEQVAAASLIGIAGASTLLLSVSGRTILWSVAALIAAEIAPARHLTAGEHRVHRAERGLGSYGSRRTVAFFSSRRRPWPSRGEALIIPLPAFVAASLCLAAFLRKENIVLLAIAACGVISIAMYAVSAATGVASEGAHALLHTAVLSAIATALASAGRMGRVRQASRLAIVLLVLTGAKLALQDLRAGSAALIFGALAVYGIAILSIGRLRRIDVTSSATGQTL